MNKPKVVFSACLLGENVRYDGKLINCPFAEQLSKYVNVIKVCPEVSIGLPVPREPIIAVKKDKKILIVNPKTGEDFTERLKNFSNSFLLSLKDIDGFLLKSKSPSCGVSGTKTYKSLDGTGFLYRGQGIFAKTVKETFPHLPVEDELKLKNWYRKYIFLMRIFLNRELKTIDTEKFHSKYRFTLFLFNRKKSLLLDKAVKDKKKYTEIFSKMFVKLPPEKLIIKRLGKETGIIRNSFEDVYKELLNSKENLPEDIKNFLSIVPDDIILKKV